MDINNTKIIKDPALGNGLAASLDIDAGEVIISIPEPFLILVEKEALNKVCSYCLIEKESAGLKRCSGCKVTQYCTITCQKSDWNFIHQKECPILKRLPGVPPTPVRGMIQVLLRHQYGQSLDPQWASLESHIKSLNKTKRWDEIILQAKAAVEFSKNPSDRMEMAINLLCRMSTNAFRATLLDDTPVGLCFEPNLALSNHSCDPNAVIIFDGRHVSLRTLNPIKTGEQIFISYVDPTQTRQMRRAELQERYFFSCECRRCRDDVNPHQAFLRRLPVTMGKLQLLCDTEKLKSQAETCITKAPELVASAPVMVPKIEALLNQCRSTSNPSERLRLLDQIPSHLLLFTGRQLFAIPPYPAFLNELYLYHLDVASYVPALIILLFMSLNCDPYTYPQPTHPARVLHLFTLAKLLKHIASLETPTLLPTPLPFNEDQRHIIMNIDYVSTVQAVLIIVQEMARKSHGKESRFMREVEGELSDVEDVQKIRGNAGLELRRWMVQGGLAVEGQLMAETLVGDLKKLAGFMDRIVEGVKM